MKTSRIVVGLILVLSVGTAVAQAAPTLASRLRSLASTYGDAQGRIPITLETGEVLYMSTSQNQQPFSIYTAGAPVTNSAQIAACGVSAPGGPLTCDAAYNGTVINGLEHMQEINPDPTGVYIKCEGEWNTICKFVWQTCVVCSPLECTAVPC